MKKALLGLVIMALLSSHDMFLKLDQYFLKANTDSVIQLYNGTFERSENAITRDRMLDVSLVGNGERINPDTSSWYDENNTTYLSFTTGSPGTWVAGVSTKARSIGMSAEDFNDYLEHDGVLDMLEARKSNGTIGDSAVERYSKHVKTVFQVGDKLTDDYKTELGYPIEFLLLDNPYDIHPGHDLRVKLVLNQKPLSNQLVYVGAKSTTKEHSHDGHSHSHDEDADHTHDELIQFRTDEQGMLNVPITSEGVWYLRTIHLIEVEEEGLTHESNWATLTFAVGGGHTHDHGHSHDGHSHSDHDHTHGEGIPDYVYGLLSLGVIAALFFWFRRKK